MLPVRTLLLIVTIAILSRRVNAQIKLAPSAVGINVFPSSGKTLDIKGENGGQIRLNNSGQPLTSLEFSNNDVRRGLIESNTSTNEFKIASETTGQSIKLYTQGIERLSVSPDGVVTLPGGIRFGGVSPTSGTLRWTGTSLDIYNGTDWQPLVSSNNPAQDKRNKTNFYLNNDPY